MRPPNPRMLGAITNIRAPEEEEWDMTIEKAKEYAQLVLSELNRITPSPVTPPPPVTSGPTSRVLAGQSIQDVINLALAGTTIELMAGVTYPERLSIRHKRLTFTSSAPVDPTKRATPSPGLPHIHGGIDYYGEDVTFQGGISVTSPIHTDTIIVDRGQRLQLLQVVVLGGPFGQHRGIEANGQGFSYRGCHVDGIWSADQDAQAVCGWDGSADFTISDCYLGASGQSVMFGGDDSSSPAGMPKNGILEYSTLTKNPDWKTRRNAIVKTSLELKAINGLRVRKNLLQYSGIDQGQGGYAIVITPRNQGGNAPWSQVTNVNIEDNDAQYHSGLVNISGVDDVNASLVTRSIRIANLRARDIDGRKYPGDGRLFLIGNGPEDIAIDNITFPTTPQNVQAVGYFYGDPPAHMNISNIVSPKSAYGWFVDGLGTGISVVKDYGRSISFVNVTE